MDSHGRGRRYASSSRSPPVAHFPSPTHSTASTTADVRSLCMSSPYNDIHAFLSEFTTSNDPTGLPFFLSNFNLGAPCPQHVRFQVENLDGICHEAAPRKPHSHHSKTRALLLILARFSSSLDITSRRDSKRQDQKNVIQHLQNQRVQATPASPNSYSSAATPCVTLPSPQWYQQPSMAHCEGTTVCGL
jgi:hypothetical protein